MTDTQHGAVAWEQSGPFHEISFTVTESSGLAWRLLGFLADDTTDGEWTIWVHTEDEVIAGDLVFAALDKEDPNPHLRLLRQGVELVIPVADIRAVWVHC